MITGEIDALGWRVRDGGAGVRVCEAGFGYPVVSNATVFLSCLTSVSFALFDGPMGVGLAPRDLDDIFFLLAYVLLGLVVVSICSSINPLASYRSGYHLMFGV